MDSRQRPLFTFFCPVCRSQQRTKVVKQLTRLHHAQFTLVAALFTWAAWGVLGIKGASIYLIIWAIFEFQYRLRKRAEFICRACGFDPFLYKQDTEKTRALVQAKLQERILQEGLFEGKKLKNYQTRQKADSLAAPPPSPAMNGPATSAAASAPETKPRAELTR